MLEYKPIRPNTWTIVFNGCKLGYVCRLRDGLFYAINMQKCHSGSYTSLKKAVRWLYMGSDDGYTNARLRERSFVGSIDMGNYEYDVISKTNPVVQIY